MQITLRYKSKEHRLECEPNHTFMHLIRLLEATLAVQFHEPKLISKGKRIELTDTISDIPLMLVGTTTDTVERVYEMETKMKDVAKNHDKYSVIAKSTATKIEHFCPIIEALELPNKSKALKILDDIRRDAGISQIMKKYGWTAKLIELSPAEATILGYNKNRSIIALRLRTDDYKGFRTYSSIRTVMLHELAHMYTAANKGSYSP